MDWKKLLGTLTAPVDEEIRLRNAYLLVENRILRQQINSRVQLTDGDRRTLAVLGQKLGRQALAEIATVAKADTILAWHHKFVTQTVDTSAPHKSVGRPRVDQEIESLVVQMARENRSWGYDRIVGALLNLGYTISDQTVGNILKRHSIPPAPERKMTMSWAEFIRMHMDVLGATDFFLGTVWSRLNLVLSSLLVFVHVDSQTGALTDMAASLTMWYAHWYTDVVQQAYFHTLGDHPKGELLFGLADGYARLGNKVKARAYFDRLITDAPGSGQAPRGRAWLETGIVPDAPGLGCFGCHK